MSKNAKVGNKIGYMNHKKSGCFWYRIKQPMDMLKENGIPTQMISLNEDFDTNDFGAFQFYGAVPFSMRKIFEFLKSEGKKIVYDMDDALDLIEPTNPFYYNVRKDLGSMNEVLEFADEVTVSCPAMKEYVSTKYKGPITVVPNCYTPSEWTFQRPKREGIRIGFAGSATHVKDLVDIIPSITNLKKKYPITFVIMGFGQTDYPTWYKNFRYSAPVEAHKDLEELDKRLAELGDFEWVQYIDFDKYPTSLINMALDIGICPLKETPFDKCRTACKAMEYTLSGALALASDTTPYREDESSILVKDTDWEHDIEFFITNPEEREKSRLEHLDWIQKNRVNTSQLETLKRVYGVSPTLSHETTPPTPLSRV